MEQKFVLLIFKSNFLIRTLYFNSLMNSSKSFFDPDTVPLIPSLATKMVPLRSFFIKKVSKTFLILLIFLNF